MCKTIFFQCFELRLIQEKSHATFLYEIFSIENENVPRKRIHRLLLHFAHNEISKKDVSTRKQFLPTVFHVRAFALMQSCPLRT